MIFELLNYVWNKIIWNKNIGIDITKNLNLLEFFFDFKTQKNI